MNASSHGLKPRFPYGQQRPNGLSHHQMPRGVHTGRKLDSGIRAGDSTLSNLMCDVGISSGFFTPAQCLPLACDVWAFHTCTQGRTNGEILSPNCASGCITHCGSASCGESGNATLHYKHSHGFLLGSDEHREDVQQTLLVFIDLFTKGHFRQETAVGKKCFLPLNGFQISLDPTGIPKDSSSYTYLRKGLHVKSVTP